MAAAVVDMVYRVRKFEERHGGGPKGVEKHESQSHRAPDIR